MISAEEINLSNKYIPEIIRKEAITALRYFPELKDTEIRFQFKKDIKKSTMQAQPTWASFFKGKKGRGYIILISKKIKIDQEAFTIEDIPSDVITGWLGHELGHVMDYRNRSSLGMVFFGIKYLFSKAHIKEVSRIPLEDKNSTNQKSNEL